MTLADKVRNELDRRLDVLGGELPGQWEAVQRLATLQPDASVDDIADQIEDRVMSGDFR